MRAACVQSLTQHVAPGLPDGPKLDPAPMECRGRLRHPETLTFQLGVSRAQPGRKQVGADTQVPVASRDFLILPRAQPRRDGLTANADFTVVLRRGTESSRVESAEHLICPGCERLLFLLRHSACALTQREGRSHGHD